MSNIPPIYQFIKSSQMPHKCAIWNVENPTYKMHKIKIVLLKRDGKSHIKIAQHKEHSCKAVVKINIKKAHFFFILYLFNAEFSTFHQQYYSLLFCTFLLLNFPSFCNSTPIIVCFSTVGFPTLLNNILFILCFLMLDFYFSATIFSLFCAFLTLDFLPFSNNSTNTLFILHVSKLDFPLFYNNTLYFVRF